MTALIVIVVIVAVAVAIGKLLGKPSAAKPQSVEEKTQPQQMSGPEPEPSERFEPQSFDDVVRVFVSVARMFTSLETIQVDISCVYRKDATVAMCNVSGAEFRYNLFPHGLDVLKSEGALSEDMAQWLKAFVKPVDSDMNFLGYAGQFPPQPDADAQTEQQRYMAYLRDKCPSCTFVYGEENASEPSKIRTGVFRMGDNTGFSIRVNLPQTDV